MPRRIADYLPGDGFTTLNTISTIGAFFLGLSMFPFFFNVWNTWRHAPLVGVDDPWGWGASLEWATSCPPPRHNFVRMPRIRSERPAFDLHHPELTGRAPHIRSQLGTSWLATGGERLMKIEGLLFAGCAVFFAVVDIVYWILSHDPTGTTALALAVGLAFLVGLLPVRDRPPHRHAPRRPP